MLLEDGANNTALSVGSSNSTPDGLVLQAGPSVVVLVDVGDTLAVVERARLAILAALDGDKSSVLFLRPLASFEAGEDGFRVKST